MTMNIKEALEQQIDAWARIGHPALLERFVLKHGHLGKSQPRPINVLPRTKKECFKNAADFVIEQKNPKKRRDPYVYVEGYAASPNSFGMLIHHAWAEDREGNVIDNTWDDPEHSFYWGVPFKVVELCAHLVETDMYGIFDTGRGLNVELMFRRDPSLEKVAEEITQRGVEKRRELARLFNERNQNAA